MPPAARAELVCPAGTLPALKAAVDHGADCVHFGFRNETNARNFGGLNFDAKAAAEGVGQAPTEIQVFGFGRPVRDGRGPLRAVFVHDRRGTQHRRRVLAVLLDRFAGGKKAGYPPLCKGRYTVRDDTYYAIEESTSLNTLELLPEVVRIGIAGSTSRSPRAPPTTCC